MGLITENTKWSFLLSADNEAEERHIYDIAFGIFCLEARSINPENIRIFIDGQDRNRIQKLIQTASTHQYNIKMADDFFIDLNENSHANIVLFVTGHGSYEGINGKIKPHFLYDHFKKAPTLHRAVIYFGQCYAGIFNHMSVDEKRDGDTIEPPLVIVGATNLFNSISASTTEKLLSAEISWSANLFLLNLFKWIKKPVDVDGDGRMTIIDSYKFAGSLANELCKKVKSMNFMTPFNELKLLEQKQSELQQAIKTNPQDPNRVMQAFLDCQARQRNYEKLLDIQFNHQESWVLNSRLAQVIEV